MSTKEQLLSLLHSQKGRYVSGEEIASSLRVSRTAVWKAVNALRQDGYQIDAAQNRGYCLAQATDLLREADIRARLTPACSSLDIRVVPTVASTNAMVRELAASGAPEGTVVIANAQTAGRGRLGRQFYSPADTGIYLSILLKPTAYTAQQAIRITTMAAVAACEAIESVSGRSAGIKWVNDIFIGGKKVCGILTEGSFDLESGSLNHVILGIGINAYAPKEGFPNELTDIAGFVFPEPRCDGKNDLAAGFLNRFMAYYAAQDPSAYTETYRRKSIVIGKSIWVISGGNRRQAEALDVDRECRLIVRYLDGTIDALSSAEVSIREVR